MAPSTVTAVTQVYYTLSGYPDTFTNTANMLTNDITNTGGGQSKRGVWRWADPDACGSGVSGPPNAPSFVAAGQHHSGDQPERLPDRRPDSRRHD